MTANSGNPDFAKDAATVLRAIAGDPRVLKKHPNKLNAAECKNIARQFCKRHGITFNPSDQRYHDMVARHPA